jgi:prepilin-type N-terminal cleavage/methylation domain-containing protein
MKRGHDAGYTLAELLVVLALLGVMAVLMAEGLRFGGRVWETASRRTNDIETVSGGQALLRTVLQRIVPRSPDPSSTVDEDLFRGTGTQMSFIALAPAAMEARGLARFELAVKSTLRGQSLVLSWVPLSGVEGGEKRVIVTEAFSVTLHYAQREAGGALAWREAWSDPARAPELVRVRVLPLKGKGAAWPELLVRPRISRDPTCLYDPVSFGCRDG